MRQLPARWQTAAYRRAYGRRIGARALTTAEVEQLIADFITAAVRASAAMLSASIRAVSVSGAERRTAMLIVP